MMENITDNSKKIDTETNNCSMSNQDNTKNIEYGYDFTNNPGKLPGEICLEIFEVKTKFEKNKWYSKSEIYNLSGGILEYIWIDPDNPNNIVYVDYQPYNSSDFYKKIITIEIIEIIECYESGEESDEELDEELNDVSNDESDNESNEKSNKTLDKKDKKVVSEIGHMIYDSDLTFNELNERFIFSKLFLGYDYKIYRPNLYYADTDIIPYKDEKISLKKLCIRRIRLHVAEELDFVEKINNSKILLKPLTTYSNYYLQWNPLLTEYLKYLIKDQPVFIKELLQLKSL